MRKKQRLRRRPPPPRTRPRPPSSPPPGTSAVVDWLGHYEEILVLFETPSGFALFHYNGDIWADFAKDYKAEEVAFLRDFQTFEDKASAIKYDTGVSDQLARMIKKWLLPKQKLAVENLEYKEVIEARLGINCLFGEAVMELMWGLKNVIKSLVPGENLETKEDCLPMSQGMKIILERYGFDVQPEMVNRHIIDLAHALYECDFCVNKHAASFERAADVLKEISDIHSHDWDPLKLVTAIKVICYPADRNGVEIFSEAELAKLIAEAPKFEDMFFKNSCMFIYEEIVWARGVRDKVQRQLGTLVRELGHSEQPESLETSGVIEKQSFVASSSQGTH